MTAVRELVLLNTNDRTFATCPVCGNEIAPGEGVTARYGERMLRFKCQGCVTRFQADPEPYLAGKVGGCCGGEGHAHAHA